MPDPGQAAASSTSRAAFNFTARAARDQTWTHLNSYLSIILTASQTMRALDLFDPLQKLRAK
eukprot:1150352-Pelagomonas_calceolata.AAC.3